MKLSTISLTCGYLYSRYLYLLNITYEDRRTNIWVWERERIEVITVHNQQCEKNEVVLGTEHQPPQRRPMNLAFYHLESGDHTTRKDDKGDQPSGGETTWTNTEATWSGRGQHKTGQLGDGTLRPSPNYGTLQPPSDDENYRLQFSSAEYAFQVMILSFNVGIRYHLLSSVTLGAWWHFI